MSRKKKKSNQPKKAQSKSTRVTLKDVAAAAGVSVMTVSNVINNKTKFVSSDTRRKVNQTINELKYRPNLSARSLRVAHEFSVGVVIVDPNPDFLSDPFNNKLLSGLSNYLSRNGYTLDIQGVTPDQFESAAILRRNRNDALGAILCGPKEQRRRYVRYLSELSLPTVIFQESFRFDSPDVIFVRQDERQGGRLIGEHIFSKPTNSVVFVKPLLEWEALTQREKGIRDVADESDRDIVFDILITASESFEDVQTAVRSYLSRQVPDALIAATDSMGIAALRAAEEFGIEIPKQMRITGYNGFESWRYTTPTLTTVISPAYELGRLAGELLVNRLSTHKFEKKSYVLPVELKVGESS